MTLIALLYALLACLLAVYGANALFLTTLFFRHRHKASTPPAVAEEEWPPVTVQLPIYNEKYVATRLIDAICALDYPRERLQIQVLDDSTDETVELIAHRVDEWQQRGVCIEHVRRPNRHEYKAGALAYGLKSATGDFIAIFDADFVPNSDWLLRTVAHFCQDGVEDLAFVQTRWGHLNPEYSPLTRTQRLALDGHFCIEQMARARSGLLLNFNGTAGLWRRACIEQLGSWSGNTLCEDFDLSYRAQLAGWRLDYDNTIVAPAEIPAQISSYKRQQFRWAKGSIQVARLRSRTVLRAPLSRLQKVEALLHMTGYMVHPLLVLLLLLTLPLLIWGWPAAFATHQDMLTWVGLAGLGAPILFGVAQRTLYGPIWLKHYRWMPLLALLGSGIALSNTRAVLEGLFGRLGGEFRRTPKFRLEGRQGTWRKSDYHLGVEWSALGELALSAYAILCCLVAIYQAQWFALPFLVLYVLAFGWVGGLSLWQAAIASRRKPPRSRKTRRCKMAQREGRIKRPHLNVHEL